MSAPSDDAPALPPRARIPGWVWWVTAALVGLDQGTKLLAVDSLQLGQPAPFLGPVASLTLTHNYGSAMGLVPARGWALLAVSAAIAGGLVIWGPRLLGTTCLGRWGLALLLGGAVGNLLDRGRLGYVIDFIDFHFWPVFNVADIAVVGGAAVLVVALSRPHGHEKPPPKD